MEERANPRLKALIIEVVNNQIRDNNPPFVSKTLDRLVADGWREKKAMEAIAAALLGGMYYVLKDHTIFNEEQYRRNLESLR